MAEVNLRSWDFIPKTPGVTLHGFYGRSNSSGDFIPKTPGVTLYGAEVTL